MKVKWGALANNNLLEINSQLNQDLAREEAEEEEAVTTKAEPKIL